MRARLGISPPRWTGLAAVLLVLILSAPQLLWFGYHWTLTIDAGRYLLDGWHLVSGQGYTLLNGTPETKRGPVFPGLLGVLMLFFGRDTESLAWAVRLVALVNPLLAYLLVKRISGPVAGLLAAVLVALFGYTARNPEAFNIDAALLTMYLVTLLVLLVAVRKNSSSLGFVSGLLLGVSLLTKETALANLPLALVAVLLFGWGLRKALWHYLGLALVCLPWWAWVWSVSGQVYLVGRLPTSLYVPVIAAVPIFLGLAAGAYTFGVPDWFLANERRRRRACWAVVAAWFVVLTGLLFSSGTSSPADLSLRVEKDYVVNHLASDIAVWPLLLLAGGYVAWKATRPGLLWRLFAIALLFQVPICLFVAAEHWDRRQLLTLQALLLCALAAFVVEVCGAALRRRQGRAGWLWGAAAVALAISLAASAAREVGGQVIGNPDEPSGGGEEAVAALEMVRWMSGNVPDGKAVFVTPGLTSYLTFLDGERHRLLPLRMSQRLCVPNPTSSRKCGDDENTISETPSGTIWYEISEGCQAASLSMPRLLRQAQREGSGYAMMNGHRRYPGILPLASRLGGSGAFEVARAEPGLSESVATNRGLILLRSTGQAPEPLPTQMDADTALRLKRCEQAQGPGYAERVRTRFPRGIVLMPGPGRGQATRPAAKARKEIERIYRENGAGVLSEGH